MSVVMLLGVLNILLQDEITRYYGIEGYIEEELTLSMRLQKLISMIVSDPSTILLGILLFILNFAIQLVPYLYVEFISQKAITQEIKKQAKQSINDLFEQQVKAFSFIQHELGNKLPPVKNEFLYLKKIISGGNFDFNLSTKVRQPLPGEDPLSIDNVGDIVKRVEDGLNYSLESLQNASLIISANKQQLQLEEVRLLRFLENISNKDIINSKQLDFQFYGDKEAIVKIDKTQFTSVLNNIISNAVMHGFNDRTKDCKIVFNVKETKTNVELIIKNNGKPFSDDFTIEDFLSPYRYTGESGNTGMGGYFIGIILKKHNANIALLPHEQDEQFKTKFLILFQKS